MWTKWVCDRCGASLRGGKEDLNCISVDSIFGAYCKYLCSDCYGWFRAFMDGAPVEREIEGENQDYGEDE